jgi:hypothetical protein
MLLEGAKEVFGWRVVVRVAMPGMIVRKKGKLSRGTLCVFEVLKLPCPETPFSLEERCRK